MSDAKPATRRTRRSPRASEPDTTPETSAADRAEAGDGEASLNPWNEFTSLGLDAMESLTRNLTAAAAQSHSMMVSRASDPSSATPPDPDPFRVGPDMAHVWGSIASDPSRIADAQARLFQGYVDLWTSTLKRAAGQTSEEAIAPERGDRRWRAKDWDENPIFDVIKQSYLLTARWLTETIEQTQTVDPETKRKVAFFTRQMADAFSPTNFPMTNPEVMRATLNEGGENLLRGVQKLTEDLERGRGRLAIRQTDLEKFQIGVDVAATPGQVVFRNELIELIHYAPTQAQTYARPMLILPPWINKFYILDLRPDNSMVRWLLEQGHPVFLASWVNPTPQHAHLSFADYIEKGAYAAIEAALEHTGADKVNAVGYCIGGTLLASAMAHMAKTGDERIASATFFAAQTDFVEAGDLLMFTSDEWLEEIERRMEQHDGVLDGQTMADTFNMLRANDLVWSFFVNNYLLGKDPRPFDLLFWNADQTRLARAVHLFYLKRFYRDNALATGALELFGERLSLGDISTPVYFQASREDHIAPMRSVYRGARLFGGPVRFTLAGSGHIAGVINPPAAQKYQHWTNDVGELPGEVSEWLEGATERPGSWWTDWDGWLSAFAGPRGPALKPTKGKLKALEPAPGSYVRARS